MEQYNVTGMNCAACASTVEKAVRSVKGVKECSVSLLTNSMSVEASCSSNEIIKAVEKAGYGASLKGANAQEANSSLKEDELVDSQTPKLKKRLIASLGFLFVLMYFSMFSMLFNLPLPAFFRNNHLAIGIAELLLAGIIMVINQHFFISGFKALWHKAPNMDSLVALGSLASYLWSVYALFMMSDAVIKNDLSLAMKYMDEFYFESAAMILTLITVGKMLEARSKGKTTDALKSLMKLAPQKATIIKDGQEMVVDIKQVKVNDIFVVKPGESIPVDGIIIEGNSAINEAAITGESIPVDKKVGDEVTGATINQSGFIKCQASRVGQDTTLSQIIKMVFDAAATKAPVAKIADKVSGIFVPTVITIATITTIIWLLLGKEVSYALARGISVLVISCPCALGLATPVAIMVGSGVAASNGILFKTALSLEETGKTQIVALDKTGTITSGDPVVTDIIANEISEKELLAYSLALEVKSEHPLAKAICKKASQQQVRGQEVTDFLALPGNGLQANLNDQLLYGGNVRFVSSHLTLTNTQKEQIENLANEGKTPLIFGLDNKLLGIIAIADCVKEDSKKAIKQLQKMGIKVVMLTGDNPKTAQAIGKQVGVDKVIASLLPIDKQNVIKKLQKNGKVAMVGDGINDAPALTIADIGIAIGAGSDVAIDAGDVVLMKSSLLDVAAAIRLSKRTLANIHENLFWAFFYNCIGIPLAAGCFVKFGLTLSPMFGAAAMSLSSFTVVSNALRLNLTKIYDDSRDKKIKQNFKMEDEEMTEINTRTLTVKGMMCEHCEMHVKKALEKLPQIDSAIANHNTDSVEITLNSPISDEEINAAIEDAGYEFIK